MHFNTVLNASGKRECTVGRDQFPAWAARISNFTPRPPLLMMTAMMNCNGEERDCDDCAGDHHHASGKIDFTKTALDL